MPRSIAASRAATGRSIRWAAWRRENLKHGPEKLKAYEVGVKTELFEGLARLNAAAYYYDYKDYQAFSIVGLTPQVTNSDAESKGGEIELTVSPTKGLDFLSGASFIDSDVDAVPDVFGGTVRAEFPLAPRTSLNFLGRYEWPGIGGLVSVQIDGRWNDDQFLEGTNSEVSFEPAYSVWNASLSAIARMTTSCACRCTCKNFTDEEYRLYDLDLGLLGFIEQAYAPPRQVGASWPITGSASLRRRQNSSLRLWLATAPASLLLPSGISGADQAPSAATADALPLLDVLIRDEGQAGRSEARARSLVLPRTSATSSARVMRGVSAWAPDTHMWVSLCARTSQMRTRAR